MTGPRPQWRCQMMLPKPIRETDEEHLALVRSEGCVGCGHVAPSDPHHIATRGSGGSDYTAVPLCRTCHIEIGTGGFARFQASHHVDLWREAHRLALRTLTGRIRALTGSAGGDDQDHP